MAYENTMMVFFIASFVALFPMLDPFGNMPIFAGLTEGIPNSLSPRGGPSAPYCIEWNSIFRVLWTRAFLAFWDYDSRSTCSRRTVIFVMGYDMLSTSCTDEGHYPDQHPDDEYR